MLTQNFMPKLTICLLWKKVVFLCSSHIIKFIIFFVKKNDKQFAFFLCSSHMIKFFHQNSVNSVHDLKNIFFTNLKIYSSVLKMGCMYTHTKKRQYLSLPLFRNALPTSLGHWRVCLTTYYDILTPYTYNSVSVQVL